MYAEIHRRDKREIEELKARIRRLRNVVRSLRAPRTIAVRPVSPDHLGDVLSAISSAAAPVTARSIRESTRLSADIVRNALSDLIASGQVAAEGGRKHRRYRIL